MGPLAFLGSHRVNGVSALHTDLMRSTVFRQMHALYPDRITNKTNGITFRRWMFEANPRLTSLLVETVGEAIMDDAEALSGFAAFADDTSVHARLTAIRRENKTALSNRVWDSMKIRLDPDAIFDTQIKRIHEYKRQLLNVLHVITRYNRILAEPERNWQPRTVIFGGKAASAYAMAKLIIKLINDVGQTINADPRIGDRLKVVFVPNYGVSVASLIIPAADLSEQISTAGTEASGTGNMKLALNGALTIGTEDGANIEIRDAVGADNIFIFGLHTDEVGALRQRGYRPRDHYEANAELRQVLDQISGGTFSPDQPDRFQSIVQALLDHGDHYLLLADYAAYIAAQERVDALYEQGDAWTAKVIRNIAAMGAFSSDRTISEYAKNIWGVRPLDL